MGTVNVSLTAISTAVPFFTLFPSHKIWYEPFVVSIVPLTFTVVPTGPVFGVIVVIVGVAVTGGTRSDVMNVVMSNNAMKPTVILPLLDRFLSKHFPRSQTIFGVCFLSLQTLGF